MISVTPQGSIYLCKTPLINDYKNQLTFSNLTSQLNYFNSRIQKTFDNYTYIKKDNVIKVGENIDTIIGCNYLFYRNNGFTNKYYFCFITNMEYINENCTAITIETDVFQTYQFDISYKACFVEREHTNDDTIGANTIDEGLELGEYVANYSRQWLFENFNPSNDLGIVLAATQTPSGNMSGGTAYNGIYSGVKYFSFKNDNQDTGQTWAGINKLNNYIGQYATASKADAIKCLFMYPLALLNGYTREDYVESTTQYPDDYYINTPGHLHNKSMYLNTTYFGGDIQTGYLPNNMKLYTYPYTYLYVTNNNGANVTYKYEDFKDNIPAFNIKTTLTPSGSIRMCPLNYKGVEINEAEGINMGKFPVCSWDTDVYTNWLTQNGVNIALSTAGSAISIGASAATGNPIGIASGVLGIANTLGEINKQSKVPPQAEGNINSGDVVTSSGTNDFIFYNMTIKAEYAQIVDNYFSCYGYKTNQVKIPNITGRTNWNYVKTLECNFTGDNIPQTELNVIRTIFNNGVTLWHNSATMLDYSQSNAIV
jgi:hypothetical protein